MCDFRQRLAQFLDVLGRESSEDRFDVLFSFGFSNSEVWNSFVPDVFPFSVEFEPFLDGEEDEDFPNFERRDRVMVEEREGREEVKSYDVGPSNSTRSSRVGLFEKVRERVKE